MRARVEVLAEGDERGGVVLRAGGVAREVAPLTLDVKSVFCVFEQGLDSRVFVCICSTLDGKHTYLGPG